MFKKRITWVIASVLALALVVGVGIYSRDAKLRASDENVYAASHADDDSKVSEGEASRVQAIIISAEDSGKTMTSKEESSEETAEAKVEKKVSVTSNMEGVDEAEEGTEVVLNTILEGFENTQIDFQWQYSEDGSSWIDIEGADAESYSFELSEVNAAYYWRVVVTVLS